MKVLASFLGSLSSNLSKLLTLEYINIFLLILLLIMIIIVMILVIATLAKSGSSKNSVKEVGYKSTRKDSKSSQVTSSSHFAKSKHNRRKVLLTKN